MFEERLDQVDIRTYIGDSAHILALYKDLHGELCMKPCMKLCASGGQKSAALPRAKHRITGETMSDAPTNLSAKVSSYGSAIFKHGLTQKRTLSASPQPHII